MADYAAPTGPPPPQVPEGWKAIWNDQYKEWFYVNLYTKQSQWDRPTHPAQDPNASSSGMPPSYDHNSAPVGAGMDSKKPLDSNNPYAHNVTTETDEGLARRLQEEENARSHNTSGNNYYGSSQTQGYPQQQYSNYGSQGGGAYSGAPDYSHGGAHGSTNYPGAPDYSHGTQGSTYPGAPDYSQQQQTHDQSQSKGKSGGLLGKLKDKVSAAAAGGGSHGGRPMGAPMMGYNAGGYPHQQSHYGGGFPSRGGGMFGGGHGGGYGGGYGRPPKKGMGMGGAAALGVGGGLLGGAMIANAMDDDDYGGGGSDYGGGDDMGGDDGGGD